MDNKDSRKDFFENLQPLEGEFSKSFDEEEESLIEKGLKEVTERYEADEEIDQGGMKVILKSTDRKTLRNVARAKLKDSTPKNRERFISEARLTAYLEHPNIVPVYDLDYENNELFFTMKLIEGENLDDLIKSLKEDPERCSFAERIQIFLKICDAIAFAHDKGIVHLDLKPANINLGKFGEVTVCDWGLAKVIADEEEFDTQNLDPQIYNDVTLDGFIKGTPGYLAPEQIKDEFGVKDEKTDIYALGGILYSLLTLKAPITIKDLKQNLKQTVEGKIEDPLQINKNIPAGLAAVAMKALSVKKDDRYTNIIELRSEINRWLNGFVTDAEEGGFGKALLFFFKRHKLVCSFILLILVLSVFFSVRLINEQRRAIEAQKLYLKVKEKSRIDNLRSVPHLMVLTHMAINNLSFDQALEYINMANEKDPLDKEVWSLKGKIHFIRQEYKEAKIAFSHCRNEGRAVWIYPLLDKYIRIKGSKPLLSLAEMAELIKDIEDRSYSNHLCAYASMSSLDLEYSVKTAFLALKHIRFNRKVLDWHYSYEIKDGKVAVDLSNHPELSDIRALSYLPINKLNISNTNIEDREFMLSFPLEELDISNTKIYNPRAFLKIKTLNQLTIAENQFPTINLPKKRLKIKK